MYRLIAFILILVFSCLALPVRQWMGMNDISVYSFSEEDKAEKFKEKEKKSDKYTFFHHSITDQEEITGRNKVSSTPNHLQDPFTKTPTQPPDRIVV
jgi:hypothetical protein